MKKASSFHTKLILSYVILITLVIILSLTLADAFFTRSFERFLVGRYGLPVGRVMAPPEARTYLLSGTYQRFHEVMRLSIWTGGMVVLALALIVASWLTRRFSRPISRFADFADRIGGGEYTAHLSEHPETQEFAQLSDALNRMAEDLDRRGQLERELFSNLSHELRTPVTVIKGYMEALDTGMLSSQQEVHGAIRAVSQETANLEGMINELRQLAQIDNNGVCPQESDFELDAVLAYIWNRFVPLAAERGVQFSTRLEARRVHVHLDRQFLDRAVANLLTNAIIATPAGKSVLLMSRADTAEITISIRDEGRGIPPADMPHIFERFFRGDRSRNRKNGSGLGLGLPIAKDLVELENGSLHLSSTVGTGTVAVIAYPASIVVPPEEPPGVS